jgi:hypothetical protein
MIRLVPSLPLFAIGIAFSSLASAGPLKEATINQIVNDVKVIEPQRGPHAAALQEVIKDDLGVHTGVQSRAELLFQDATLTRLGAETFFSFKPGTRDLNLERGTLLLQVPKNLGGARIRAASVTASITGTTIMMEHLPSKSLKIVVLEGSLRVGINGRVGENLMLTAGKMVIMAPDAKRVPEPVDVDLRKLIRTSSLIDPAAFRGKSKASIAVLPSMGLIDKEIARQDGLVKERGLVATNLVIPGSGTSVVAASDEALAMLDKRSIETGGTRLEATPPTRVPTVATADIEPKLPVAGSTTTTAAVSRSVATVADSKVIDRLSGGITSTLTTTGSGSSGSGTGSSGSGSGSSGSGTGSSGSGSGSSGSGSGSSGSGSGSSGSGTGSSGSGSGSSGSGSGSSGSGSGSSGSGSGSSGSGSGSSGSGSGSSSSGSGSSGSGSGTLTSITATLDPALPSLNLVNSTTINVTSLTTGQTLTRKGGNGLLSGLLILPPGAGDTVQLTGSQIDISSSKINGINVNGGDGLLNLTQEGGDGGIIVAGTDAAPIAGNITVAAPITATTGKNSLTTPTGGKGGAVQLVSNGSVTVSSSVKVSDTASGYVSKSGGSIGIKAANGITVSNTGQLLSLLAASAPGTGGTIKFVATGGDITVTGGKVQADRGTVEMLAAGANNRIELNNATVAGDVVKVGALGANGELRIGGGTINADSALKLYGGTTDGQVRFTNNVTLGGAGTKTIAGRTVSIDNGKTVTIGGPSAASVFTDHANYTGSGGNGSTTGQFGGKGATTRAYSQTPAF